MISLKRCCGAGQPQTLKKDSDISETRTSVEKHLASLQKDNGRFEREWVWNSLVTSAWVITQNIVDAPIAEEKKAGLVRYYEGKQRDDGSWGWHGESEGYLITTTLGYISLRLLGIGPEESIARRARDWIHAQPEGVQSVPMLGKIWLASIDLYEWEGVNTVPAELWFLPSWFPAHPGKYYTFFRMALTSLMYISGVRFRKPANALIEELRGELYRDNYTKVDWPKCRHLVARTDLYHAPEWILRKTQDLLSIYDQKPIKSIRKRALEFCFEQILYEERTSLNHTNTPLVGLLNCVAIYANDPNHPELAPSLVGKEAWKIEDDTGIRYNASRSSVWDTAFSMQALLESPNRADYSETLSRAYEYLLSSQMVDELPERSKHARDPSNGSWSFGGLSELGGQLGWPVTDCTAESIVALLMMDRYLPGSISEKISGERLVMATEFLLQRQNDDGSYGHYERCRDKWILPRINITEILGSKIMIDFPCSECTASCICALVMLRDVLPSYRSRIDSAVQRAVKWVKSVQRSDGSYYSEWGINYTYAIHFVVKGLLAGGVDKKDPVLIRAADWLTGKQQADGGWGESYKSCLEDRYIERESHATMTSWALLALLDILGPEAPSVVRGIEWLRNRVREDGSVPDEGINGIFFTTCGVDYRLYPVYFPAMALIRYQTYRNGPHAALESAKRN